MKMRMRVSAYALLLMVCGCAPYKYHPAPVSPPALAHQLEARKLDDAALRAWMQKETGFHPSTWPLRSWNLRDLTLVAFYFNPALKVARARVAEADAAIITAGQKPNPSVSAHLGGETLPSSPWLAGLGFSLPIETAGKRGYRITEAQRLADVARWNLATAAWIVRAQVRSALVEYLAAQRNLGLLQNEERVRSEQVKLLEQRLAVGMIPRPEVDLARIQQTQTLLAVRTAEGRQDQARVSLAAAIGVPVTALNSVQVAWPEFDDLPSIASLTPSQIQEDAVLSRLDIRQALAQYAAADAALRLEAARQYPNLDLGPSWAYEEGAHLFSLDAGSVLPIRNQNQGPIAEAKARREEMAANFVSVQTAGIAASEQALAKYKSALSEMAQARQLLQQSRAQEQATQKALDSGQSDRVALNGTQLQTAVNALAQLNALDKAQQAMGALENAVQRPLLPGDIQSLSPASPLLHTGERKSQ